MEYTASNIILPSKGFNRIIEVIKFQSKNKKISKLALTSIIEQEETQDIVIDAFIFNFGKNEEITIKLLKEAGFSEIGGIHL